MFFLIIGKTKNYLKFLVKICIRDSLFTLIKGIICSWSHYQTILQNINYKRPCEVTTWTILFTLSKFKEVKIIRNEGFEFSFLRFISKNAEYQMRWRWKLWWDRKGILRQVQQEKNLVTWSIFGSRSSWSTP